MLHRLSNTIGFLIFFILVGTSLLVYTGHYFRETIASLEVTHSFSLVELDLKLPYWINYIVGLIILGANFWIVKSISSKHRFVEEAKVPFVMYYLIFISFFPALVLELELILSSSICLLMLYIILTIYNQTSVMLLVFVSSILLGLASALYYPFAVLVIVLLMAISFFRSFEIREYIIAAIGILLPFFYLYSIAYLGDSKIAIPDFYILLFSYEFLSFSLGGALLFLLSFISFVYVFITRSKLVVRQRNQLLIVMTFILVAFLMTFFLPKQGAIVLLAAPLSLCFQIFYQNFNKKWILDLYLLLLLTTSIVEKING